MSLKTKNIVFVIDILLSALIAVLTGFWLYGWNAWLKVLCYVISVAGLVCGTVFYIVDKDALLKSCFLLILCAFVIIGVVALLSNLAHLNEYPSDGEKIDRLTEIIKDSGAWGMLVFVLIQILQVVILPLPAAVCYIPGSIIWGGWLSTLLASAGVIVGSVIAYAIGRFLGKKAVEWVAGKDVVNKYIGVIGNKGKTIFLLMQILPFFPDDILCMVAGLTCMNFPFFMAVMVIVRPLIISVYCFLGTGTIIPFSGWGIPVWLCIFAVCIALAVLSLKYQDRVEKWVIKKFSKKDKKSHD